MFCLLFVSRTGVQVLYTLYLLLSTPGTERKAEGICSERRRGKRAVRTAARVKHEAAKSEVSAGRLTFFTFNLRTTAVNVVNGIGRIGTLYCKGLWRYRTAGDQTERNFRNGGIRIPCLFQP